MRNILEYLENTARRLPDKDAFVCEGDRLSFSELRRKAALYGMRIAKAAGGLTRRPVCVIGERDINALVCMLACVYSGNFYVLVDASLPKGRIEKMLDVVDFIGAVSCSGEKYENDSLLFSDLYEDAAVPAPEDVPADGAPKGEGVPADDAQTAEVVPADSVTAEAAPAAGDGIPISEGCTEEELERFIAGRIADSCSFDPLYGIFTSGTTGDPKLVVKSHSAMMRFIDVFVEMFGFSEADILGNQFPFYFDASTKDLFCCLKCGLTVHIIPKKFFSFPQFLIHYLIEQKITRIIWVPSALSLVANTDSLRNFGIPESLEKVFFVGEQMPVKQLNYWKNLMPRVEFVNIYGATETAGNFLYYIYDKILEDDQRLPTGKPFPDTKVFLLKDDNTPVEGPGIEGEICVVSDTLSLGYYGNPEMTNEVFVQNPAAAYREIMYRTGDLATYDEDGNIVWSSRRDFQIKHMGYRIELSEIEITLGAIAGIGECCCIYDEEKKKILFFYQADRDLKKEIGKQVRDKLPKYMFPSKYIRLDAMPHNANGKIDRKKLAAE